MRQCILLASHLLMQLGCMQLCRVSVHCQSPLLAACSSPVASSCNAFHQLIPLLCCLQLFFGLMSAVLVGVKYKSDKRDQFLHHGGWLVKLMLWLGFNALPFFFPVGLVNAYGELGAPGILHLQAALAVTVAGLQLLPFFSPAGRSMPMANWLQDLWLVGALA